MGRSYRHVHTKAGPVFCGDERCYSQVGPVANVQERMLINVTNTWFS